MKNRKLTILLLGTMIMSSLSGCGLFHKSKTADDLVAESSFDETDVDESDFDDEDETEPELETSTEDEDSDDSASDFIFAHSYNLQQDENRNNQSEKLSRDNEGYTTKNGYRLIEEERDPMPDSAIVGADSVLYTLAETTDDAGNYETSTVETIKETEAPTTAAPQIIYVDRTETTAATKETVQETTKAAGEKGSNIPGESETHEVVPYAVQNEFADGKQILIQDLPTDQK